MLAEKIYIHFDKPSYIIGDTIWFKAYLFDGTYHSASEKSGQFYLELVYNDNNVNKVMKRMIFPLKYGLGWGNIALDENDYPEGEYTIRAYTNWMQNNGEHYLFTRPVYIAAPSRKSWLVHSDVKLLKSAAENNVAVALQFHELDKKPVGLREMQLSVVEGKRTLYTNRMETTVDGTLDVRFTIPEKADTKNITIIIEDLRKGGENRKLSIPVITNRYENTDLQFLPEGGKLVSGIASHIGFKAIGEDGRGIQVSGRIINGRQQEVGTFKSVHNGMGSFELIPREDETYSAQVNFPGFTGSYPLPKAEASGTVLRVNNPADSEALEVSVSATADIQNTVNSYYLIGQARGVVCYAKEINFKDGIFKTSVTKSIFPTGIARFTLLNKACQPLNERMIYIDHKDGLHFSIITDKSRYKSRDSIALNIHVTDKDGLPVQGSFSLSVTDDWQVKQQDSVQNNSIYTYLLFTSELKGTVEDPGYYTRSTPQAREALDKLLLTQGWTDYDWKGIVDPPVPRFLPEPEFMITGKATSSFRGIPNTRVILYSQKPFMLKDTVTDQNGRFTFKNFPFADTAAYLVQAYNRNGKSFIVNVEVDEFKPPELTTKVNKRKLPWYVNSDSIALESIKSNMVRKEENTTQGKAHQLKEVVVIAKKTVKDSYNLNGPGGADQVLNERDILKSVDLNLLDLLYQKIPGLKMKIIKGKSGLWIYEKRLKIIIDGVDLDKIYEYYDPISEGAATGEGLTEYYTFIRNNLEVFKAGDVKGIEVMYNSNYNGNYNRVFLSIAQQLSLGTTRGIDYAYVEITTRNGKGPFMKKTQGVYLYKPMPFSLPRQFYRPRYEVNDRDKIVDLRSTLHWEPNIVTDAEGKATVSFYASDKAKAYTIVMEGSEMNGKAGSIVKKGFVKLLP